MSKEKMTNIRMSEENIEDARFIYKNLLEEENLSAAVRSSLKFTRSLLDPNMTVEKAIRSDVLKLGKEEFKKLSIITVLKNPVELKKVLENVPQPT